MTNDLLEAIRLWLWHITIAGFEIQAYLTNVSSLWITVWFLILRPWTDSVTNVKAITSILHTSSPWLAAAYFSCFSNICSNNGIFFQEWIPWICWRVLKPRGHSAASSLKTVYPQIRKSQGQRWRVTDEVYPPQIMGQFTAYAFVLIGGAILILLGPDHQNSALGQSIYILIAASARFLAYLTAARKQWLLPGNQAKFSCWQCKSWAFIFNTLSERAANIKAVTLEHLAVLTIPCSQKPKIWICALPSEKLSEPFSFWIW